MAIGFARMKHVSRGKGQSLVQRWSYVTGTGGQSRRTGTVYAASHREDVLHRAMLLPDGHRLGREEEPAMWDEAEDRVRANGQFGVELLIALPRETELDFSVGLLEAFVARWLLSQELIAGYAIHSGAPDDDVFGHEEADKGIYWNVHAHVVAPLRRYQNGAFTTRFAGFDPLRWGLKAVAGVPWGDLWGRHQDEAFLRHGLDIRVPLPAPVPSRHHGPVHNLARKADADLIRQEYRESNAARLASDLGVQAALAASGRVFDEKDVGPLLHRFIDNPEIAAEAVSLAFGFEDILRLAKPLSAAPSDLFVSRAVREAEERIWTCAQELSKDKLQVVISEDHLLAEGCRTWVRMARNGGGLPLVLCSWRLSPKSLDLWGHPESDCLTPLLDRPNALKERLERKHVVFVPGAEQLGPWHLLTLLEEVQVAGCHLVLLCPPETGWLRRGSCVHELRKRLGGDMLLSAGPRLSPQASALFADGQVRQGLAALDADGRLIWAPTVRDAESMVVVQASDMISHGTRPVILAIEDSVRERVNGCLAAHGASTQPEAGHVGTPEFAGSDPLGSAPQIAVARLPPLPADQHVLVLLTRASSAAAGPPLAIGRPVLFVPQDEFRDIVDLERQLSQAMRPSCSLGLQVITLRNGAWKLESDGFLTAHLHKVPPHPGDHGGDDPAASTNQHEGDDELVNVDQLTEEEPQGSSPGLG